MNDGKENTWIILNILICVRPMVDKDDYMFVTNVFDGWITLDNKPFNVMEYESRCGNYKLCEVDDLSEFVDFRLQQDLNLC